MSPTAMMPRASPRPIDEPVAQESELHYSQSASIQHLGAHGHRAGPRELAHLPRPDCARDLALGRRAGRCPAASGSPSFLDVHTVVALPVAPAVVLRCWNGDRRE